MKSFDTIFKESFIKPQQFAKALKDHATGNYLKISTYVKRMEIVEHYSITEAKRQIEELAKRHSLKLIQSTKYRSKDGLTIYLADTKKKLSYRITLAVLLSDFPIVVLSYEKRAYV